MAIYVLLQCCKCNNQKRIHLFSCSINKDDITYHLCQHFTVRYTYTCKFGFLINWSIVLNVKAICKNCNRNLNFGDNTFNSRYYNLENHAKCCHHVFRINVSGSSYASDTYGIHLQETEDNKTIEEQKKRLQRQAIEEQKKRLQRQEQLKVQQIINDQNEEENQLIQESNFNLDFIENERTNKNNAFIYDMNKELNFDIGEHIEKKNEVLKFSKFEIH